MVRVKTRLWAVAWIGAMTLAGAVPPATHPAQAREAQAPVLQVTPGYGVQLAGLFDWLTGKQAPAPAPAPQTWEPQLTPAPQQGAPAPKQGAPARRQQRSGPPGGGGTYRTLCVRACDGYYFPISFKVRRSKFNTDSVACLQRCSGAGARLYVYRNPGQEVNGAIDLQGNRYVDQDNAFRYRTELVKGCDCKPAPWAETGAGAR